jgi:hypothetical protein
MAKTYNSGRLYGEKTKYSDGVGCTVYFRHVSKDGSEIGLAFDFSEEDIDDMIALCQELKGAEPDVYEEEPSA